MSGGAKAGERVCARAGGRADARAGARARAKAGLMARAAAGKSVRAGTRRAGRVGAVAAGAALLDAAAALAVTGGTRNGRRGGALGLAAMVPLLVAALAVLAAPAPAAALVPVVDYTHILVNQYWHYTHYVQFALQIYQQYQALTNQVRQIDNQLQALRKLSNPNWREVYDLLANLDFIMRQGQALAYSYKNIDGQFQQAFPGWVEVQSWPAQRQLQAVRTLDTMRTGLDTVSEQFRHDIADQLFLERIKAQMDGIGGHQEALELGNTIAMYSAQELGVIKQSLATGNNLQAVYYGHQINREAQGEATFAAGLQRTLASNRQAAAPGYGALPTWWPFF